MRGWLREAGESAWRRLRRPLQERLTPAGRFLLAGAVLAAGLGFDTTVTMAFQAFSLQVSLLAGAFAAAWTFRPKVLARRILPACAKVGEPLPYRVRIKNLSSQPLSGLSLLERAEGLEPAGVVPIPALLPGAETEVLASVVPTRRGRLRWTGLTLSRPEPLGLARGLKRESLTSLLPVLPRRYDVPSLALPGRRRLHPGGVSLANSVGESLEFMSIREYQMGDPLRRIHWKSWAKAGKPMVREFKDEYFVRQALILDTFAPEGPAFEEAVSVAASLACSLRTQDSLLDLLFVADRAYCLSAGRGVGGTREMLEVLADVGASPRRAFAELAATVSERSALLCGTVLVLLTWDEQRRDLARRLQAAGVACLILVVSEPGSGPAEEPGVFTRLETGRIPEGLARLSALI